MALVTDKFRGKRIAVLGLGASGAAAAALARHQGADVVLLDSGSGEKVEASATAQREKGVEVTTGDAALAYSEATDLVVVSPGIDPTWPIVCQFTDRGIPAISEIEFAWQNTDKPCVGITGTNGKTTTTELTAALLNGAGVRTVPCGNYGTAFSEVVLNDDGYDCFTVELSSFQLELITTFRPAVAVWMNFAPDHLDRHPTIEAYHAAKLRIFEFQTAEDSAVMNGAESYPPLAAGRITFSAWSPAADFTFSHGAISFRDTVIVKLADTNLRGLHNAENIMAAMAAARAMGVEFDGMQSTLRAYRPPRHRCELAGTVNGVDYLNDSKATNIHAMESALRGQEQPVVLIAGGKDKGLDYAPVTSLIAQKTVAVFTIGEIRDQLVKIWGDACTVTPCASLEEAVERAAATATAGQTVLFAPGTSSFDMFTGYGHRGDVFCQLIRNLKPNDQP